jgi:hypothetical protein
MILVSVLGLLAVTACTVSHPRARSATSGSSPGSLARTEQAQAIQAQTSGLHTFAALLAVAYTLGPRQGTFDLAVNYTDAGAMRFTAFKSALLQTQVLFDLLLKGETFQLLVQDDTGTHTYQGTGEQLARAHPPFRAFYLIGEAFLLPGFDSTGKPPQSSTGGRHWRTTLAHGGRACWTVVKEALEISAGRLRWQTAAGPVVLRLQYEDYRRVDAYRIPHRVLLQDRRLRFIARSVIKQIEINVPLAPEIFTVSWGRS